MRLLQDKVGEGCCWLGVQQWGFVCWARAGLGVQEERIDAHPNENTHTALLKV